MICYCDCGKKSVIECADCAKDYCKRCKKLDMIKCPKCQTYVCEDCPLTGRGEGDYEKCEICRRRFCNGCLYVEESHDGGEIAFCHGCTVLCKCGEVLCSDCIDACACCVCSATFTREERQTKKKKKVAAADEN